MEIQIDTREKQRAIVKILQEFDRRGIKHISSKLYVGDYMNFDNPKLIVDRKQNLQELCSNVCQQHDRFISEIKKANDIGIKIVFLIEHGGSVRCLQDVANWKNPRLKDSPLAVSGERLHKIMSTLKSYYNVDFEFCDKRNTGRRIIEILSRFSHEMG